MSRTIAIWYNQDGVDIDIEIDQESLLGGQRSSMAFWNKPILKEIGLKELTRLGYTDPIFFSGWEHLSLLEKEISILENNLGKLHFHSEYEKKWIKNLRYCLNKLTNTAPKDAIPHYSIG